MLLAGCGGGNQASKVADTLRAGLIDQNDSTVTVDDVTCVHEQGRVYQCFASLTVKDTGKLEAEYRVTCDNSQCIWRRTLVQPA